MSGNLLILAELSLVFLVVFGWGFNELRQLKKYRQTRPEPAKQPDNATDGHDHQ